jgi:DNA-directed RNA polymerase subunit RPC12/RpoP
MSRHVISKNTRRRDLRKTLKLLTCSRCGLRWNVSSESQEREDEYLCPRCRGRIKKEEQYGKDTKQEGAG